MRNIVKTVVSLLLLSLVGCSTVEKANDVTMLSKSNYVERVKVDSIFVRDSIFIREKADTVFYTQYRTLYKERLRVDTLVLCDTVYCDREVVIEKSSGGNACGVCSWKLPVALLLAACVACLLWRTGLLRVLWNLILKGVMLCTRVFRLKV